MGEGGLPTWLQIVVIIVIVFVFSVAGLTITKMLGAVF
jgi:hypothetical protein